MPNASMINYGYKWDYLKAKGWQIKASNVPRGTANCDCANKTIWMKPSAFNAPRLRIRKYVVPHEIWHALHCEILQYECSSLQTARNLNKAAALEVVADGGVLNDTPSKIMGAWVRASVIWHGKVGYKYKYSDLVSPEALQIIRMINLAVKSDATP
jgi:hypothetical protein